ncbi:DUF4173 domain-containing protein [Actinomadura darangshiensis]|uniref:DUF4173 domain-containing protein n=1 Tax=Actinomadura darangshiensis TaxID=705336 RepID=A0A4R5A7B7_9ACTN|nr:DUF4173 domain-containing protein [Actinomadura darangshiensis]TDD66956.1 DUF4173 domain-containing protein [Actinomadura darangshiensis]
MPRPVYKPTKLEQAIVGWKRPARPMSPALAAGVAIAGVIGAVTLGPSVTHGLGVGLLIAATAVAYVAGASAWSAGRGLRPASAKYGRFAQLNRTGIVFLLLAVGLSATAAFRDAEWVVVPAILLAMAVGSYGTSGGRSWPEVLFGGVAFLPAVGAMTPWTVRGAYGAVTSGRGNAWPAIRTGLIAAGLLGVFGGLFVGADAAFGSLASGLVPEVSVGSLFLYGFAGVATLLLACAGAYLGQSPPPLHLLAPERAKPAGRWSWAVPIAALDLLFLVFCAIQAGIFLAGDKDELLRSTGLTYAEYARQGFFQLVVVTVLVLAVVAVAKRYAPSASRGDRGTVRVLLGLLCALTLVVVAVALRRLYLYEESYGWTRLRLWVHAFELWLGVVVVMVAVAGVVRGRVAWLPRAVAATGAIAMLALVAVNPDQFIAEHNVARYRDTGKIDIEYLRNLSADAVPALDELDEPMRSCALRGIAYDLKEDEPAMSANLARNRARDILAKRPSNITADCSNQSSYRE